MARKRKLRHNKRDISKAYREWKKKVFARDGHKCQMPSCKGGCGYLQAHHIRRHADAYSGRLSLSNGITLGKDCHERIKGKEHLYSAVFTKIVIENSK